MEKSSSNNINGDIQFKPEHLVNNLKNSLEGMHVEIEQHSVLKNTITIKYLFETTENDEESYHQITIESKPSNVKENNIQITFDKRVDYATNFDDFTPKFRFFEINSDEDLDKLHDLITTLVVNNIHFTKTLQRLEFEELY